MSHNVFVYPTRIGGFRGYEIGVVDVRATVGDYLEALEEFLATAHLDKRLNAGRGCLGCGSCCRGRIPLTSIDYFHLVRYLTGGDAVSFFRRFAWVAVNGRVVDITLRRDAAGRCIFLDTAKKTCRIYQVRPLVCRTFTCAPAGRRALKLRSIIINTGEDELVRVWLAACDRARSRVVHAPQRPRLRRADWRPTPFAGHTCYTQVPLRNVCPPAFWRTLAGMPKTRGGG